MGLRATIRPANPLAIGEAIDYGFTVATQLAFRLSPCAANSYDGGQSFAVLSEGPLSQRAKEYLQSLGSQGATVEIHEEPQGLEKIQV